MTIRLIALAAGLVAVLSTSAFAQGPKRTCNGNDILVELADGKKRCWDPQKQIPQGAKRVQQDQPTTAAPKPNPGIGQKEPSFTLALFAQAAEKCLAEANALSNVHGERGCFIGKDGRPHCTHEDLEKIALDCKNKANALGRPERWNSAANK